MTTEGVEGGLDILLQFIVVESGSTDLLHINQSITADSAEA